MESLYSPSWHRVAGLRPRLSPQARFARHQYRGQTWYVVQNPTSGRVHRIAPRAYALVGWMDGERTTEEVWNLVVDRLKDDAPTQDETLNVLGLLHAADLLRCDVPEDTVALLRRVEQEQGQERWRKRHPLSLRLALFDPDRWLSRWAPWVRCIFSRAGAILWCAVVLAAGVAALKHAPELAAEFKSLGEPAGLLGLWLAYPLVKALHELGHAFAVVRWGGAVHEVGLLLLVLVPVPYVDASAASVFAEKHRRMVVGAAGIAVELFLAALATFVWIAAEPGLVRAGAYAVMAIGGLSTLFVNGNPLVRFDGYYVLADALEIPGLAAKGNQYLGALARRSILGLRQQSLPETTRGEATWLIGYAIASFAYRITMTLSIALYLAGHYFVLGVALAIASVTAQVALPALRHIFYVLTDPVVAERRGRALLGSLGLAVVLGTLLVAVPLPLRTRSEGVVWLPERSHVRAGAEGFVVELLSDPHREVRQGDPLIRTRDPALETRLRVLEAQVREQAVRIHSLQPENLVQSEIARERLAETEAALARAREQAGDVVIVSPADGVFVLVGGDDLLGRYVKHGEGVAFVVDLSDTIVRVVVPQEQVALLREPTTTAWVRLAHDLGTVLPARIVRAVPAATNLLPIRSLGTSGGGRIAVDPLDPDGLRTLEPMFEFDLALPEGAGLPAAGARVYVRFDHVAEPLAKRGYRALRRLFLRQLGV